MVCLGFVTHPDKTTGELLPVTNDYVINKDALYQIDIAGRRFNVNQSIHPPKLPNVGTMVLEDYHPTLRDKAIFQAKTHV
jgi:hypothetical protein